MRTLICLLVILLLCYLHAVTLCSYLEGIPLILTQISALDKRLGMLTLHTKQNNTVFNPV